MESIQISAPLKSLTIEGVVTRGRRITVIAPGSCTADELTTLLAGICAVKNVLSVQLEPSIVETTRLSYWSSNPLRRLWWNITQNWR